MATPRFAWGIDIGNRALKAIRLVREGDTLRMDDVEVIEHEQVLSNSGDNRESLIQTALANFAQRHQTKGSVVAVGVSGQSSFARFIKLPPVEEKKIPEIVKFEAVQQIPFPLDSVEWSYQLFRQPDSPEVEVGIFAMRKELVNQQIKYFTDMNMNVQVVQMNPLAVYNAMYYDTRLQDGTTMILDLGAENADLIIADGESVWLRSLPIGGNHFTEALVKAFKLNFTKAEDLKRNAQTSKYARQIFQAMRPIFADLVAEIQRSIGFYSSVHRDSRIKRIIALGNTFRLPTLQKYLQQNLQIEVERLDGFAAGAPADARLATVLTDNISSMASAYGLALQAMGQGKIGSSLLPHEIRQAKIWKEKTKWFALAASLFVAAGGAMFGSYYFHNEHFESQGNQDLRRQIDATLASAEKLDRQWAEIEQSGGPEKQRIHNVRFMSKYHDLWADLWYDIASTLPKDNATPVEELKKIARGQRQQAFIDSVTTTFVPDITSFVNMGADEFKAQAAAGPNIDVGAAAVAGSAGGGYGRSGAGFGGERPMPITPHSRGGMGEVPAPVPAEGADPNAPPAGKRGYLVTLQLTSPNQDASRLISDAIIGQLATKLGEKQVAEGKEKKPYYVARATIASAAPIRTDQARMAAIKAAYDARQAAKNKPFSGGVGDMPLPGGFQGGGGAAFPRGGRGFGGGEEDIANRGVGTPFQPGLGTPLGAGTDPNDPAEKEKAEKEAYKDPLFPGEVVTDDWQVTVVLAIGLDPEKPKPAEPGTTDTSTDAQPGTTEPGPDTSPGEKPDEKAPDEKAPPEKAPAPGVPADQPPENAVPARRPGPQARGND